MRLYKRGRKYWVAFRFNGEQYRRSTKTAKWRAASIVAAKIYLQVVEKDRVKEQLPKFKPRPEGDVYFIRSSATGKIKIGWSRNAAKRLKTLQGGSSEMLEPLLQLNGTPSYEIELQIRFRDSHHKHEWFNPTEDLLAFIKQQLDAQSARESSSK